MTFYNTVWKQAGKVWTAPSSVPVVRGVWDVIRHAYVPMELHVTLWMASVHVPLGGGENTATIPAL